MENEPKVNVLVWVFWLGFCGACCVLAALIVKFGDWIFPW